ncbi:cytochrome P450 [Nonomuraea sp. FMUSA5-5]|uniref:Cytochrome P450 n=1 Tax=Nonomuraea composti TaxID=2720023 RepID=A0ABX1AR46_9ACTN|nr:cytochrome P450 [Nonomuraea sp. FMUSA5-5]
MPPRPAASAWEPWLGSGALLAALSSDDRLVERMFERTGGMFRLWLPGAGKAVMLADPALVRDVCRAPADVIDAARANRVQEPVIGRRGLACLDGQEHRRLRQVMAPAVRERVSLRLRATTERLAQRVADDCPLGVPFALGPRLHLALMEAILSITLGLDPAARRAWEGPLRELFRRAASYEISVRYLLRQVGGLALWPSFHRSRNACDRLIHDEIARRRHHVDPDQADGGGDDLLGMLLRARGDDGARLTNEVIRDQVMSMIAGARTTTATGLTWAFERLVRHPEVMGRLTAESDKCAEDAYAGAVVYEALRVRPPVAFFGRVVRRPFELGGRVLSPGTTIVVHLRSLHHAPGLHPDPETFRPERWLGRRPGGYGWMPFGAGTHTCLGDQLAIMQMKVFLQVFARTLDLSPARAADEPVRLMAISNTPGEGCRVVARRRAATTG